MIHLQGTIRCDKCHKEESAVFLCTGTKIDPGLGEIVTTLTLTKLPGKWSLRADKTILCFDCVTLIPKFKGSTALW